MRRGPRTHVCEQMNEIPYTRTLFSESCLSFRRRLDGSNHPERQALETRQDAAMKVEAA